MSNFYDSFCEVIKGLYHINQLLTHSEDRVGRRIFYLLNNEFFNLPQWVFLDGNQLEIHKQNFKLRVYKHQALC